MKKSKIYFCERCKKEFNSSVKRDRHDDICKKNISEKNNKMNGLRIWAWIFIIIGVSNFDSLVGVAFVIIGIVWLRIRKKEINKNE